MWPFDYTIIHDESRCYRTIEYMVIWNAEHGNRHSDYEAIPGTYCTCYHFRGSIDKKEEGDIL